MRYGQFLFFSSLFISPFSEHRFPLKMNALIYGSGGEDKMVWKSDYSPPAVGKNQLLVKVLTAGLNPIDYKVAKIWGFYMSRKGGPVGVDVCGVVEVVGKNVESFKVGDTVFGFGAGLAEKTIVAADQVAKVSSGISAEIAGGVPVAALTGYQMLKDNGAFDGTQKRILIIGGSGGVGSCAVQIAKALCGSGSTIVAVCSGANAEFVKSLGADEILDYSVPNFKLNKALPEKSVDVVVDCVTSPDDHDYVSEGMSLLKEKTGRYVAANTKKGSDWLKLFLGRSIGVNMFRGQYSLVMVEQSGTDLAAVGALISENKLKLIIQETVPFTETAVRGGYSKLKQRRTKGKIVVKVAPETSL